MQPKRCARSTGPVVENAAIKGALLDKKALRARFLHVRSVAARDNPDAGHALAARIDCKKYRRIGDMIAGYCALGDELDPAPLLARLRRTGAHIGFPRMDGDRISFRLAEESALARGPMGIRQPPASARPLRPDLIFLPLLACDRQGGRLGRGGGHYDRALAALAGNRKPVCVGLAFDEQVVDSVPRQQHDQNIDYIETPTQSIICSESSDSR